MWWIGLTAEKGGQDLATTPLLVAWLPLLFSTMWDLGQRALFVRSSQGQIITLSLQCSLFPFATQNTRHSPGCHANKGTKPQCRLLCEDTRHAEEEELTQTLHSGQQ